MYFVYEHKSRRWAVPIGNIVELTPFLESVRPKNLINSKSKGGDLIATLKQNCVARGVVVDNLSVLWRKDDASLCSSVDRAA